MTTTNAMPIRNYVTPKVAARHDLNEAGLLII